MIEGVLHDTWDFIEGVCPPEERMKWQKEGYPPITLPNDEIKHLVYLPKTDTYYYCIEHDH